MVTLTAQDGLGRLLNWTGDCTGGGACVLTMDADKDVLARFALLLTSFASIETEPVAPLVIGTTLSIPGGRGEVSVGGRTTVVNADTVPVRVETRGGDTLVEGVVGAAAGSGLWRFELGQAAREPGTVTVLSGEPATVTPYAIVFRLKGRPGERVSFVLRRPSRSGDTHPAR